MTIFKRIQFPFSFCNKIPHWQFPINSKISSHFYHLPKHGFIWLPHFHFSIVTKSEHILVNLTYCSDSSSFQQKLQFNISTQKWQASLEILIVQLLYPRSPRHESDHFFFILPWYSRTSETHCSLIAHPFCNQNSVLIPVIHALHLLFLSSIKSA